MSAEQAGSFVLLPSQPAEFKSINLATASEYNPHKMVSGTEITMGPFMFPSDACLKPGSPPSFHVSRKYNFAVHLDDGVLGVAVKICDQKGAPVTAQVVATNAREYQETFECKGSFAILAKHVPLAKLVFITQAAYMELQEWAFFTKATVSLETVDSHAKDVSSFTNSSMPSTAPSAAATTNDVSTTAAAVAPTSQTMTTSATASTSV